MAKPAPPSLTDYAVTAISPILIMAMVGSLVFFLVEVLYGGKYSDRLLWTLFFFVVGTVLIARIMILHGASRGLIYAAGLAAATFLALQAFVDYPNLTMRSFSILINAALMAIIWWSANKLTWDCTHIDEDRRNAGRGVLDAAGLDAAAPEPEEEEPPSKKKLAPNAGWIERWQYHREQQNKKPHTPGVWVLYFSLASLPIFGLGQSLIPPEDGQRRRVVFQEMAVFVGSGLGLLMTTTLLGLRKYLRDRGANIPTKMTGGWLGLGAAIIVLFLAIGAALPRPHSETPLVNLPKLASSKDREANRFAIFKGRSGGKGDGAKGNETEHDEKASQTKDGKKGQPNRDDKDGDATGGSDSSEKSNAQAKGEKQADAKRESEKSQASDSGQERSEENRDSSTGEQSPESTTTPKLGNLLEKAGSWLKWLAWIIVALLLLAVIAIFLLRYLAPFTSWAKNLLDWLSSLFQRKAAGGKTAAEAPKKAPEVPRPPPFESFANPFASGRKMKAEELVTYSFTAFESWAWDRGYPRRPDETPFEFARRIESATGFNGEPLVKLYGQVVYSPTELPNTASTVVRDFWLIEKLN
jgi:hypothetical protein